MIYSTLLIAATALTGFVSAQNYSTSGPISVVPNSVPYDTRLAWCRAQTNSCPEICGGEASPNTCDANSLNYTCTCTNGNSPNISNYDQTIPSFECAQWKADCVAAHPNDLTGQTGCLSVTCGSANASSGESSSTSSAASSSATGSASASSSGAASSSAGGAAGGAAATTTTSSGSGSSSSPSASSSASSSSSSAKSSSAATALNIAQNYGTSILGAALLAVFGLAL